MWVPSHVGITSNEMANKSADLVIRTMPHCTISHILINAIKFFINQKINITWKNYRNSIPLSN